MNQHEFALALNALLPDCDPEAPAKWAEFATRCVNHEQFVYFIPTEYHNAVEKWLDASYAGLYMVKQEYGLEIATKMAGLCCQRCDLYPCEMMPAAKVLQNGGDAERLNAMMASNTLGMDTPYFLDLPDGAALTVQGPEISIAQSGVPCGLVQKRVDPGYMLADGTALLESERDNFGRYRGGAGMDGMYLQTGRLYAPVRGVDGGIRAFQEVKPVTAREREAGFLSAAEDGFAIYHLSGADPQSAAPLARLEKEGKSPLEGGYNLVHVVYTGSGSDDRATLEACKATGVLFPGDIMAFKQNGVVTSWYMDQLAYTKMPRLLENVLKAAEMGAEQNYNQIDGIINNEAPLASENEALYLVDGAIYLHIQTSEDDRDYTHDDCFTTYDYTLYDKETMGQLDSGRMEIAADIRDTPSQIHRLAAQNILECRTLMDASSIEPLSMDILDALHSAVDAITNDKPSLLAALRQCQKDANKSQGSTAPPNPSRGPER